jgi:hypothetical protein
MIYIYIQYDIYSNYNIRYILYKHTIFNIYYIQYILFIYIYIIHNNYYT